MATKSKFAPTGKYFELLATAVAGGQSIRDAASTYNCSPSHAYHLSNTEEFKQRVFELRAEITSEALGKLTQAATMAVDTLVELMAVDNAPPVRMNAAKAVLANLGPLSELSELRARLDAIERERAAPKLKKASA